MLNNIKENILKIKKHKLKNNYNGMIKQLNKNFN